MVKSVDFKNDAGNASTGEIVCGYNITNRSEKRQFFQKDHFNPFLWKSNKFTKILVEWKVNKQDEKIAKYLNTLVKRMVEGNIEDPDGFEDGEKEEFLAFEKMAEDEAEIVDCISDVLKKCSAFEVEEDQAGRAVEAKKATVAEIAASDRKTESKDKEGLEEMFRISYVGRRKINRYGFQ